jgi:hypothetical protein
MGDDKWLEYAFYGTGPIIEFKARTDSGMRAAVVKVDDITSVDQLDGDLTRIVLQNGRTLLADHPYSELRRIILEARSQFATLLDGR